MAGLHETEALAMAQASRDNQTLLVVLPRR